MPNDLFDLHEGARRHLKVSGNLPKHLAEPLLAQIERVRELHACAFDPYLHQDVCAECSDDEGGHWTFWPCNTIKALDGRASDQTGGD